MVVERKLKHITDKSFSLPYLHCPFELMIRDELVHGGLLEEVCPLEAGGCPQRGHLALVTPTHLLQDGSTVFSCHI